MGTCDPWKHQKHDGLGHPCLGSLEKQLLVGRDRADDSKRAFKAQESSTKDARRQHQTNVMAERLMGTMKKERKTREEEEKK
jgi:hypothetical protein